jgi:thymidylate synthase (FAD)
MKLVKPSSSIWGMSQPEPLEFIERHGRRCYQSEGRIAPGTAEPFVRKLIERGHESVLEHVSLSVEFVVDRGVSHELVRHRLASYSQESTRYCNYGSGHVAFVIPPWLWLHPGIYDAGPNGEIRTPGKEPIPPNTPAMRGEFAWAAMMLAAARTYQDLVAGGWSPQRARSVLPSALKTEIGVTANVRQWREIFRQRTAPAAHPQMREVMVPLLRECREEWPALFDDIECKEFDRWKI